MRITSRFLVAALGAFACVGAFAPIASAADTTPPTMPHFASGSASAAGQAPSIAIDFGTSTDPAVNRERPSGIREYVVHRADRVGNIARLHPLLQHRFVDRGLLAGTEYTYTVRAIDWAGNSGEPISVVVRTNGTAPAYSPFNVQQPNGLGMSAVNHTSLLLSISAPTHKVARYLLYRDADPIPFAAIDGTYGASSVSGTSVTQYTVKDLAPSTTYSITVRPVDDRGVLGVPMSVSSATLVAPPVKPKTCVARFFGTCLVWR